LRSFIEKFNQRKKDSHLCIGLDPDLSKMPEGLQSIDKIIDFNRALIDATVEYAAAYKPNSAFYEQYGLDGLLALKQTIEYIPDEIPVILDAKRGDIGNTSRAYARAAFEYFQADAITVAPYMGQDSVVPFLEFEDKYTFVLCLTSNSGANDFEKPDLYLKVANKINEWNTRHHNCGLVAGATQAQDLNKIRALNDDTIFLIPGIGAQGGDLRQTLNNVAGKNNNFLINSSRSIIYADNTDNFAQRAAEEAHKLNQQILKHL